ncbi:MAG: hypothetical protein GY795_46370 [Desulfobacterales bacterium]|nr:hypothetical protein [Desulfobacterales bacterium]
MLTDKPISVAGSTSVGIPDSHQLQQSMEFPETEKTRFVKSILGGLEKAALHAGSSNAAVYINQILHTIHCMDEQFPDDLISDALFALHDALAYNGQWITYTSDLFERAAEILKWCAGFTVLNSNQAEEAIMRLDEAGFLQPQRGELVQPRVTPHMHQAKIITLCFY